MYGLEGTEMEPSMEEIERVAKLANAHDFIQVRAGREMNIFLVSAHFTYICSLASVSKRICLKNTRRTLVVSIINRCPSVFCVVGNEFP